MRANASRFGEAHADPSTVDRLIVAAHDKC